MVKRIAFILALIFLVGAMTGTISAMAKDQGISSGSATASEDPTFSYAKRDEHNFVKSCFGTQKVNAESLGFALWTDEGFTVTQDEGSMTVLNTAYSYLGSDGIDTKCDFSFRQVKSYARKDEHFSCVFFLRGGENGSLTSRFYISLEDKPGTYESAYIMQIHDDTLWAVDKNLGEKLITKLDPKKSQKISYHVDLLKQTFQVWLNDSFVGEFAFPTERTDDTTACQYFGYIVQPDRTNIGKSITLGDVFIFY